MSLLIPTSLSKRRRYISDSLFLTNSLRDRSVSVSTLFYRKSKLEISPQPHVPPSYLRQVFMLTLHYRDLNVTVDCNDLDRMDRAALVMTSYGDRSNSKPLTPRQVHEELCPKLNESSRIIKAYAKTCFKPFPRQVIGLLVKGNLRELKNLCSSKEERHLFSKHSECLKDFDPESVHNCMDDYIIDAESVRDNVHDLDLKLPYSCCIFWNFKQCIREEMGKGCSKETVIYADDKITRASQESLDLTCKNYEEYSSNCLSLPPLQRNKHKTHISYLPALVDIFTNL